jgi:hypothetical protein
MERANFENGVPETFRVKRGCLLNTASGFGGSLVDFEFSSQVLRRK